MSAPFCAICLDDIEGAVYREPLGRNGVMVACCKRCITQPVRNSGYSFNGGRATDGARGGFTIHRYEGGRHVGPRPKSR